MRFGNGVAMSLVLAALGVLLSPRVASAYIDPGTGSYLLQMAIGGLLGGLFALKLFWHKLATAVRRMLPAKKGEGEPRSE